jgi:hypothetical protein
MTSYLNFKIGLKVKENITYPKSMEIGPVSFSCEDVEKVIEVLIRGLDKKPIVSETENELKKSQENSKKSQAKNSTNENHSEHQIESDAVKEDPILSDDNENGKEQGNGESKLKAVEGEGYVKKIKEINLNTIEELRKKFIELWNSQIQDLGSPDIDILDDSSNPKLSSMEELMELRKFMKNSLMSESTIIKDGYILVLID